MSRIVPLVAGGVTTMLWLVPRMAALNALDAPSEIQLQSLASPAPANSAQPQLNASSRGVLLSWIERAGGRATLKFAERTPSGWSNPQTVASGDNWFVNWADVPSVLRLADGTLAAHWLQKSGPETYAYDVRLSYSRDDGKTWSASFTPHQDGTKTEHGFASLFEMPGSGLGLVWLDGRAMRSSSHDTPGAAGVDQGAMTLRFGAFDRRWKQTSEAPIDFRVCECCPTTAAMTDDGPIVAFRNRSEDEIRDIYTSRLVNGQWTEPKAVHPDGWRISGCPVNGPMLSARGRDVAIAWFTTKDGQGRAFASFSNDAGRTFGGPIRLDDGGSLGRVDIELLPDGAAVASWIEYPGQGAQFRTRRVERSGAKSAPETVANLATNRTSGYPRIARHGDELVFAWIESSGAAQLRVNTAVARTPRPTSR